MDGFNGTRVVGYDAHSSETSRLLNGSIEDPEAEEEDVVPTRGRIISRLKRHVMRVSKEKRFPKSVFFIIGNEFCERFSYYGMRTVLTLYLTDQLNFSDDTATVIFHVFSCLCYFTPLFGAMLADSVVGKFNTILYVSILYAAGNIVLALASTPPLHFPMMEISMLGLGMIAIGTGGIKPCVSAYGGDQFDQDQAKQRQRFFSIFYFSINAGSLISTLLTPTLRADVKCFGNDSCFPLAFGVPAALMVVAVVFFASGKNLYRNVPQSGSVLIRVFGCVGHALRRRLFSGKSVSPVPSVSKREHWLEYADDKYDRRFIRETRAALRVMYLYLPLPIFWALYDQQGSRWTLQATQMDGALSQAVSIQPDQIQVVNAILILIFIPLFEAIIYPLLARCSVLVQPLRRIFWGGILAAVAFVIAAGIEIKLESTLRVAPSLGHFDVSFVNALPCDIRLTLDASSNVTASIKSQQAWSQFSVALGGDDEPKATALHHVQIEVPDGCVSGVTTGKIEYNFTQEYEGQNAYVSVIGLAAIDDRSITIFSMFTEKMILKKSTKGKATVRIMYNLDQQLPQHSNFLLISNRGSQYSFQAGNLSYGFTGYDDVDPTKFEVRLPGENKSNVLINGSNVKLVNGGVYSLLVSTNASVASAVVFTEMDPNSLSMLWQIPQYAVITVAEILFSITGLEFSYSQSPLSMKSVLQAAWLMTTAVGDLIVVIVAEAHFFDKQYKEFFLFAGLMVIVMVIFALMAYSYKYVGPDEWTTVDDDDDDDNDQKKPKNGAVTTQM